MKTALYGGEVADIVIIPAGNRQHGLAAPARRTSSIGERCTGGENTNRTIYYGTLEKVQDSAQKINDVPSL